MLFRVCNDPPKRKRKSDQPRSGIHKFKSLLTRRDSCINHKDMFSWQGWISEDMQRDINTYQYKYNMKFSIQLHLHLFFVPYHQIYQTASFSTGTVDYFLTPIQSRHFPTFLLNHTYQKVWPQKSHYSLEPGLFSKIILNLKKAENLKS